MIETRMLDIVVEQLSVDREKVIPTASFVNDLGADSLDLVELIMAMEEEFGVEIPDEQAEKIVTVQQAIDFVKKKLPGAFAIIAENSSTDNLAVIVGDESTENEVSNAKKLLPAKEVS